MEFRWGSNIAAFSTAHPLLPRAVPKHLSGSSADHSTKQYITNGRTLWTLARDRATPFPGILSRIHPTLGMPFAATIFNGCLVSALGCIYVGSTTAFNAFVGSFVLMSSASYTAAILP
jgi:hypothetical protein